MRSEDLRPKGRVSAVSSVSIIRILEMPPLSCLDDVSEAAMQLQHDDAACLYMNRRGGG